MSYERHLYKRLMQGAAAVGVGVALGAAIMHHPSSVPDTRWVTVTGSGTDGTPAPTVTVTVTVAARPSEVAGAPCDPSTDGPDCIPDSN